MSYGTQKLCFLSAIRMTRNEAHKACSKTGAITQPTALRDFARRLRRTKDFKRWRCLLPSTQRTSKLEMRPQKNDMSFPRVASARPSPYPLQTLRRLAGSGLLAPGAICLDEQIPPFVEEALDQLYGHVFSSLAYYQVHDALAGVSTYARQSGTDLEDVFLFRRKHGEISVLNEGIPISEEAMHAFADTIFARYPETHVLHFHAVEGTLHTPRFPCQVYNCTDDTMIALPVSAEMYLESLGSTTRKNMRRYQRRLIEDFPDYVYQVHVGRTIKREFLHDIIALNRVRMLNKNKQPGINRIDADRLWDLARTHGVVGTATIDGKVCAGAIAFRFGDNVYSFVRAHDPVFDSYRLGLLGGASLISECIRQGAKEFHFLWGRETHKLLLGGKRKDLQHITLYRSRRHMLRHAGVVIRNVRLAQERRARLWLHAQRERDTWLWRTGRTIAHAMRSPV